MTGPSGRPRMKLMIVVASAVAVAPVRPIIVAIVARFVESVVLNGIIVPSVFAV